jgi:hypothetical protein
MLSRNVVRTCLRVRRSAPTLIRTYVAGQPTPTPQQIREAAAAGTRLNREEVAEISRREEAASPSGQRVPGGPAATAQSIYTKQQQLDRKLDEISTTPPSQITEKDVGELHSAMTKGRGGKPVEKDNIVSDLHKIAQTNEGMRDGAVPLSGIDKEDAAELQSEEAVISGTGRNEKGGLAAQAQSIADQKNDRLVTNRKKQ